MAEKKKATTKKPAKRRPTVPIELNAEGMAVVEAHHRKVGLPRTRIVQRIVKWFAAQNDRVRGAILQTNPPSDTVDVSEVVLEPEKGRQ